MKFCNVVHCLRNKRCTSNIEIFRTALSNIFAFISKGHFVTTEQLLLTLINVWYFNSLLLALYMLTKKVHWQVLNH